jgi:hypothetical protein
MRGTSAIQPIETPTGSSRWPAIASHRIARSSRLPQGEATPLTARGCGWSRAQQSAGTRLVNVPPSLKFGGSGAARRPHRMDAVQVAGQRLELGLGAQRGLGAVGDPHPFGDGRGEVVGQVVSDILILRSDRSSGDRTRAAGWRRRDLNPNPPPCKAGESWQHQAPVLRSVSVRVGPAVPQTSTVSRSSLHEPSTNLGMLGPQAHALARGVQPCEPILAQRSNM